jgi:RimJ/RimL family protein N-acetyltransferase
MDRHAGDAWDTEIQRTQHCELLPLTVELAHKILAGDLEELHPAKGWPHPDTSAALSHVLAEPPAEVWLIQVEGRTIGDCGTHGPVDATGSVEIGYGLAQSQRGQGYGTEVVTALTRFLTARPEVTRVFARAAAENVASWKVLEKAGFRRVNSSSAGFEYEFSAHHPG